MAFVLVDELSRLLIDLPKSLRLDAAAAEESSLVLILRSAARSADCPCCDRRSSRVHGEYIRVVVDARLANVTIAAKLVVRRFRCVNRRCERSIFAERLSVFVQPHARRSQTSVRISASWKRAWRSAVRPRPDCCVVTQRLPFPCENCVEHRSPRGVTVVRRASSRGRQAQRGSRTNAIGSPMVAPCSSNRR